MQCGFNYFTGHEHDDVTQSLHTMAVTGSEGVMYLAGMMGAASRGLGHP